MLDYTQRNKTGAQKQGDEAQTKVLERRNTMLLHDMPSHTPLQTDRGTATHAGAQAEEHRSSS
eukprot:1150776-Pelagomonas_calceolata.AAC.8